MIPVARPSIGKEELSAINNVFETGWLGLGSVVFEFENKIDDEIFFNLATQFNLAQIRDECYTALVIDSAELNKLIDTLRAKNLFIKEIIQKKSSLEEMFISIINEAEKKNNL